MKWKKVIFRKISLQLLLAIFVSYVLAFFILGLFSKYVVQPYLLHTYEISPTLYNIILFLILLTTVGVFIVSFLLFVRKKVLYLKKISNEITNIANGDLEVEIEVRGHDELANLTQNINKMSAELKAKFEHERLIEQSKNELISSVSHDLRTPLTSIIGYLDLLKQNHHLNKEKFLEYLDIIDAKTQNLNYLINDLFEYTKLTSPNLALTYSKVDISLLLQQLTSEYHTILKSEGISVNLEIMNKDMTLCVDVDKIVRVFTNLLDNVRKYAVKPSDVFIVLKRSETDVLFSIHNQVQSNQRVDTNQMFDQFYRANKSRTNDGSAGLGLSISKRIVELHNGEVWAKHDGEWIAVYVQLPL